LSRSKNKNPPFPPDISIITWNYDLLLEKSYFEFCLNPDFVIDEISKNSRIIRLNGFAMGITKPIPELTRISHKILEGGFYSPNFMK
jgi:hypothetical protein